MRIYISHSRKIDYQNELYTPLKKVYGDRHEFILPHEANEAPFESRRLMLDKKVNVVLAELSVPSTSQGIELGWADAAGIPIIGIAKPEEIIGNSLQKITKEIIIYANQEDLIKKLGEKL